MDLKSLIYIYVNSIHIIMTILTKIQIYHYKKKGLENCIVSGNSIETIVFLKKTSEVEKIKYPTQERYTFEETNNTKENLNRKFKNLIIKILKYFPLFLFKKLFTVK